MNIAIIGSGAVAKTFMQLLASPDSNFKDKNIDLRVCYMFNSTGGISDKNGIDPTLFNAAYNITTHEKFVKGLNIQSIDDSIDLVVDLKSTIMEQAENDFDTCLKFIREKKHVVCANKAPVVFGYKKLKEEAYKNNVEFQCGCAACAALPSIIVGEAGHSGSKIHSFEGIVNGTTNYIISKMEDGMTYNDALNLAKSEGIAEKNSHNDTSGLDTAIKTIMLANIIWNKEYALENVSITGIDVLTNEMIERAAKSNLRYKLIGCASLNPDGSADIVIEPKAISPEHLLYSTSEKYKAIVFSSNNLGNVLISGSSSLKGAAAAILRDIVNICLKQGTI